MLSACETPILMDVDYSGSQLVVEGYIQQGYPAYVFLTRSEGYFDPININTLDDIAVGDAKVFVERDDGPNNVMVLGSQIKPNLFNKKSKKKTRRK